jgi:hypothetical protein
MLPQRIVAMINIGHFDVLIVEAMLLVLALCCWLISSKLAITTEPVVDQETILNELIDNSIDKASAVS